MNYWIWIISVNFLVAFFYVIYRYGLRNYSSPRQNRRIILFLIISSVLLPLLPFLIPPQSIAYWELPELTIYDINSRSTAYDYISIATVLKRVYFIGIIISASALLYGLFRIINYYLKGSKMKLDQEIYIVNPKVSQPFSFMRFIFLPSSEIDRAIKVHEQVHVKELHSIDLLFIRILTCISWFNPIWFLWMKECKMQHEFLADDKAYLSDENQENYIKRLISSTLEVEDIPLAHEFASSSLLFQRIRRLQKQINYRRNYFRALVIIPTLLMALFLTSAIPSQSLSSGVTEPSQKIEEMPSYVGGVETMSKILGSNLDMSSVSDEVQNGSTAYVSLQISEFGSLSDAKVVRGFDDKTNTMILNAVQKLKDWNPGLSNGKPVKTRIVLPIKLQWE